MPPPRGPGLASPNSHLLPSQAIACSFMLPLLATIFHFLSYRTLFHSGKWSSCGSSLGLTLTYFFLGLLDLGLGDAFLQVLLAPSLLLYFALQKRAFLGSKKVTYDFTQRVLFTQHCWWWDSGQSVWSVFLCSAMSVTPLHRYCHRKKLQIPDSILWFGRGNCSKIIDGDLRIFGMVGQIHLLYLSAYHKTPRSGWHHQRLLQCKWSTAATSPFLSGLGYSVVEQSWQRV